MTRDSSQENIVIKNYIKNIKDILFRGIVTVALLNLTAITPASSNSDTFIDPRLLGLREVSVLQLSIGAISDGRQEQNCNLDRDLLERRGVNLLTDAGIRVITLAERQALRRRNASEISRQLGILERGGELPEPNSREARRRRENIDSLIYLPVLMMVFSVTDIPFNGDQYCALAVSATFQAWPSSDAMLGATGQRVFAGMLIWERQARAFSATRENLTGVSLARVDDIVREFVENWRAVNGR
jgi:hypothetical protein